MFLAFALQTNPFILKYKITNKSTVTKDTCFKTTRILSMICLSTLYISISMCKCYWYRCLVKFKILLYSLTFCEKGRFNNNTFISKYFETSASVVSSLRVSSKNPV